MSQELVKKHSLWLTMLDLQPTVDELAEEAGNPTFIPHMTLIGNYVGTNDDAISLAQKIAKSFGRQFAVDFSGFDTRNEEYRFFCFLAKPNSELDELYEHVHEAHSPAAQETFRSWPHASLLYGTESAQSAFPSLDALKARFGETLDGTRNFNEIAVFDTSGGVKAWSLIGSATLAQSSSAAQ
jgi:hypothetical protein